MKKSRALIVAAVAIVAALAVGSAFAFSGSQNNGAPSSRAIPRGQEPEETEDVQEPGDSDVEDADDVEDGGAPGGAGKAALIAEEFGVSADEVLALRAEGIGWGALFKLYTFARAKGTSVDALIAAATLDAEGERDFAFGEIKKSLTPDELARIDDGPKNFGQLVSKSKAKKPKPAAAP